MPRILTDANVHFLTKAFASTPDVAWQAFEKDFIAKTSWPVTGLRRISPPLADAWIAVFYYGIDRYYKTPQSTLRYSDFREQFSVPSNHSFRQLHADKLSSVQSVRAARGWTTSFFADLNKRNVRLPALPGREFIEQLAVAAATFPLPDFATLFTAWLPQHLNTIKKAAKNSTRFQPSTRIITAADLRAFIAWIDTKATVESNIPAGLLTSRSPCGQSQAEPPPSPTLQLAELPQGHFAHMSDHDSLPSPRYTNAKDPFTQSSLDEGLILSILPQFDGASEINSPPMNLHAQYTLPQLGPVHRREPATASLQASLANRNSSQKHVADYDSNITLTELSDGAMTELETSLHTHNQPGPQRKKSRLTWTDSVAERDLQEELHSLEEEMDATLERIKANYEVAHTNHNLAVKALEKHNAHLTLQYNTSTPTSINDIISKYMQQIAKIGLRITKDQSYLCTLDDNSTDSDGHVGNVSTGVASAIQTRITRDEKRVQHKIQQKVAVQHALLNLNHCKDRVVQTQTALIQANHAWEKEKTALARHTGWLQTIQTKYSIAQLEGRVGENRRA